MASRNDELPIPEVFALAVELMSRRGHHEINKLDGCCVVEVDAHWTIAMNGHPDPCDADPGRGGMSVTVPPFNLVVWWHGWLAGLLTPAGGTIVSHLEGANEERLVADLQAAIDETREMNS